MTAPKRPASVTANAVAFLTTSAELRFGDGFHEEEYDGVDAFRWMSRRGLVLFEPAAHERFLELWLFCEFADLSQRLRFESDGQADELELVHGWAPVSVPVPAGSERTTLQASRVFPAELHSGDPRDLALRVRLVRLHADAGRHAAVHRQWANAALNTRELLMGRTALESTPP